MSKKAITCNTAPSAIGTYSQAITVDKFTFISGQIPLDYKNMSIIEGTFEDGFSNDITSEYLRCFSPSAEVKGHGPGQEKLQINKEDVVID